VTTTDPRLIALRDKLPGQALRGSHGVHYHLRDCIGEGGQGWVFTANWDEPGGFVVIVKVLRPDVIASDTLDRFQREAEVLRRLSQEGAPNPYIVRFFDHAVATMPSPVDGEPLVLPFTVLEYVNGRTIEQTLEVAGGRGLSVDRTRRVLHQVVMALDLVHSKNIVHRDLKPSNILLATEAGAEVAKVTDFGLVKVIDIGFRRTASLAGASLGYAPPEQFEPGNKRVSNRTDVFSLAAIVFEMLTGARAFPYRERENPLLVVTRILTGPRPLLADHRASLPDELAARPNLVERIDAELSRALAADPADRHASVVELGSKIEPLLRAVLDVPAPPLSASRISVEPPLPESFPSEPRSRIELPEPAPSASRLRTARESPPRRSPRWTWRIAVRPLAPNVVRAAAFAADGQSAIGVGPGGFARWDGAWAALVAPSGVDARLVNHMKVIAGGDVVAVGQRGLAARWSPSGAHETWPLADREAHLHGFDVDDRTGEATLVGERPARPSAAPSSSRAEPRASSVGIVTRIEARRVTFVAEISGTSRLRAAARLPSGQVFACGDGGVVVRVEGAIAENVGSLCAGNLLAIAALPGGDAVTVGVGGHALHLSPRLDATLEGVQTTRDIMALAVGDGAAWAGAAQARILHREGDSWVRMNRELGLASAVIALWASPRMVRAICDDGAVVEGQPA